MNVSKLYYNNIAYLTAVNWNIHSQIFLLWGFSFIWNTSTDVFQTAERATEPAASSEDKETVHKQWSIHSNCERDILQVGGGGGNNINSQLQLFCQKAHGCAMKIIFWTETTASTLSHLLKLIS